MINLFWFRSVPVLVESQLIRAITNWKTHVLNVFDIFGMDMSLVSYLKSFHWAYFQFKNFQEKHHPDGKDECCWRKFYSEFFTQISEYFRAYSTLNWLNPLMGYESPLMVNIWNIGTLHVQRDETLPSVNIDVLYVTVWRQRSSLTS